MKSTSFSIKVIADITCDIEGSIPSTIRSTTIDTPVFDFDRTSWAEKVPFSQKDFISVMAVDNLPCELPRDASESFGNQLISNVLPALVGKEKSTIIVDAMMTHKGLLTNYFQYLSDYVRKFT